MTSENKTWMKVFVTLLVLVVLPYVMMLLGFILTPFDLSGILFMPTLLIHNLYFFLPELVFGSKFYPAEEFGYLPGVVGYSIATLMYGIIAFALSFPMAVVIRKFREQNTEAND